MHHDFSALLNWGLRKYSGGQSHIWGGDPLCDHEWQQSTRKGMTGGTGKKSPLQGEKKRKEAMFDPLQDATCEKCGAWRGELGLEPNPEKFIENMVEIFREVMRVLRDDGTLWLNLGSSYNGSGGAGGDYNKGGLKEGQPKYPGRNATSFKQKDLVPIPWMVAMALQADGWYLRSDIIWSKNNPMPESVTDRPTKSHEYIFLLTKNKTYYYDQDAIREDSKPWTTKEPDGWDTGNGSHFTIHREGRSTGKDTGEVRTGRNKRSVWEFPTQPFRGSHFAVFPEALVEPCILAGTSEKGCCPNCKSPWKRIVDVKYRNDTTTDGRPAKGNATHDEPMVMKFASGERTRRITTTLGWQPTCECWRDMPDPDLPRTKNKRKRYQQDMAGWWKYRAVIRGGKVNPAMVFDPFLGSGTSIQVARKHGRNGVGLDLSEEYLHLARERLSLDKWDAWTEGIGIEGEDLEDNGHKNMRVPRQPHSFHKARVKDKQQTEGLPLFDME